MVRGRKHLLRRTQNIQPILRGGQINSGAILSPIKTHKMTCYQFLKSPAVNHIISHFNGDLWFIGNGFSGLTHLTYTATITLPHRGIPSSLSQTQTGLSWPTSSWFEPDNNYKNKLTCHGASLTVDQPPHPRHFSSIFSKHLLKLTCPNEIDPIPFKLTWSHLNWPVPCKTQESDSESDCSCFLFFFSKKKNWDLNSLVMAGGVQHLRVVGLIW